MKTFFASALLTTTCFTAKHSLMSYDKIHFYNINSNCNKHGYNCYYTGFELWSRSDLYVSATQQVEWTDDSSGINFKQLGLFEAFSKLIFYWTPHSDYFHLRLAATIYPLSFSFFDNVLTVTLGSLADLTSADGFSVCTALRWSYGIFKLSFSFGVKTYGWVDSIYDTLFNNDQSKPNFVYDPSYGYTTY